MYRFKELKKASKREVEGKQYRLAVLGDCATQFLSTSICGYARMQGVNLDVYDIDYDQIDAQLLDSSSETYHVCPDYILLYLATDKLYEDFLHLETFSRASFAESVIDKLDYYWNLIGNNCKARIFQMNFTEIDDKIMGSLSCKVEGTFIYQIRKLNYLLMEKISQRNNVYPIDLLAIQVQLGQIQFYDAALYYNTKMAITMNALPSVAKAVIDIVKAMQGKIKKCVVLDLDNTVWGGVIGDDGLGNIEIGELGRGHAFTNLQLWLKQLKDRGILLAVCSKNNEETAKEPFEKHEEMVLRLDDISIFIANWNDKASNIRFIQKNLNIGMDSLVFLDDNPFERNLVRAMIPEIEVPELPEDPALYLGYLQECNLFETATYSEEDRDRTKQYQEEFARKKLQQEFTSIDDYLESLEMIGAAKSFESIRYARIAQLTQRSNQFNLRTIRYTEDEIERLAADENYLTLYYTLQDKFGDHGLVSVAILKKLSDKELFIETWLMSCRVLKRGMEEFIINYMVKTAKSQGFQTIYAEYIPTPKNSMVKDIYGTMGFSRSQIDENRYELKITDYEEKRVFIKEE